MPVPARGPLQWREQTTLDRIRDFVKSKHFFLICALAFIFIYLVWPSSTDTSKTAIQVGFQGDVKLGVKEPETPTESPVDLAAEKAEDEVSKSELAEIIKEEKKAAPVDRLAQRSLPPLLKETDERASTQHDLVHSERILCELQRGEMAANPSTPHTEESQCHKIGENDEVKTPLQYLQENKPESHAFRVELRDHPNSNGGVVTVVHEGCKDYVGVHPNMYDSPALAQLFAERFGPDLFELRLVGPEFQVIPLEPLLDGGLMQRNLNYPDISFSCTYQATYHVAISGIYDLYVHLIHSKFEAIRFFPANHPRPQNAQLVHVPSKFIQAAPVQELIEEIRGRKFRHEKTVEEASSNYRGLTSSDGTEITTPKDRSISGARAKPGSPFYHMMLSFLKQDFPFWQQSTARWIRNDTWLAMQNRHPRETIAYTLDGHGQVMPPFIETKTVEVYASGASSVLAPSNEGNAREFDWTHESTFHPLADLNRYRLIPLVQWSQYSEINQPNQADAHKWIQAEEDKFLQDPTYKFDPHSFQLPNQGKLDGKCEIIRQHEINLRVAENKARDTFGQNFNADYASLGKDFLNAEFTAEDLSHEFTGCIAGKNLLFVGDEHMGQLFQQVVRTIGGDELYQIHEKSGKSPIGNNVLNPEAYPGMECVAVVPYEGRAVQRKFRDSESLGRSSSDPNTRLCYIYTQDLDTLATQSIKIPLTSAEQAAAPGEKFRYSSFWDLLHMRGEPNKLFAHIFLNFGVWPARKAMTFEVYADELNEFMERYQLELRARIARYKTEDANAIGRKGMVLLDPFPLDGLPRGRMEVGLAPARLHRQLTFISAFMHPRVFHQDVGNTALEHRTASDRRTALILALYNELAQTILTAYDVPVLDSPFQQSYLWVDQLALKEDRLAVYRDQMEERLIQDLEKEVEENPTVEALLRVRKFRVKREKLKAKSKAAAEKRRKQDTDRTIIPLGLESRPAALAAHLASRGRSAAISVDGNELAPHGVFMYGGRIMSSVSSDLFFHIKKVFKCPSSLVMRKTKASQDRVKDQIRTRELAPSSLGSNSLKDPNAPIIRIRAPNEYFLKYHREMEAAINAGRPQTEASGVSKGSNPEMDARRADTEVEYDMFSRVVSVPHEKHLWPKDVIEEPEGSGIYRQLTPQEKSIIEAKKKKAEMAPQSRDELMKQYRAAVAQAEIDEKKEDEEEERKENSRKEQAAADARDKALAKQGGKNAPRIPSSNSALKPKDAAYLPRKNDPVQKQLAELRAKRAELAAKIKATKDAESKLKSKIKGKAKSAGSP